MLRDPNSISKLQIITLYFNYISFHLKNRVKNAYCK